MTRIYLNSEQRKAQNSKKEKTKEIEMNQDLHSWKRTQDIGVLTVLSKGLCELQSSIFPNK